MGGAGSGRRAEPKQPIPVSPDLFIPNHSGISNHPEYFKTDFSAGSVVFSNGVKLTEDNFNLFWNNATKELQPNLMKITSDGSQASPALKFNDTNTGFFKSGDSVRFSLNNSTIMALNSTGIDITGDITVSGEVKGTKHSLTATHDAGGVVTGVGTELFLKVGEVLMTSTKGITALHNGSLVGIGLNFDLTTFGGVSPEGSIIVEVNGAEVWVNTLGLVALGSGTDKKKFFTQARGTDTFVQGDTISWKVQLTGGTKTPSMTVAKLLSTLEYYYDD